tara:strand:- start:2205 stop:2678 length:474 start_codon:yes stop_codon:yes gene_type:complete
MEENNVGLKSEQQQVMDNYGLVVSQALAFCSSRSSDLEDYIQSGLIGLLKAIRKHDPKRSKLSTYATTCIRNEIIKYINKNKKHNVKKVTLEDIEVPEKSIDWDTLTDSLSEEEKSILKLRLGNNSYREISDNMELSRNYIKSSMKTILIKLRKDLG